MKKKRVKRKTPQINNNNHQQQQPKGGEASTRRRALPPLRTLRRGHAPTDHAPTASPRPAPATPGARRGSRRAGGVAWMDPAPPAAPAAAAAVSARGLPARIALTLFSAFVLVHTSRWSRSESFRVRSGRGRPSCLPPRPSREEEGPGLGGSQSRATLRVIRAEWAVVW